MIFIFKIWKIWIIIDLLDLDLTDGDVKIGIVLAWKEPKS